MGGRRRAHRPIPRARAAPFLSGTSCELTVAIMKTNRTKILAFALVTLLACRLTAQTVPNLINYQGRLTDSNGAPLTNANYGIEFRLWDSPSDVTGLVWGQRQNVGVQANGVFNVILGAAGGSAITNPVPAVNDLAFAFTTSNRFLGMTVVASN